MKLEEIRAKETAGTPPLLKDRTSHVNPRTKSEPITKVQADSVLTRQQLPNLAFRISVSLVLLVLLLFVAALYYGTINP